MGRAHDHGIGTTRAAAEINYLNSCRSRFSGVFLVFEVFQTISGAPTRNPSVYWGATQSCPLMALKLCKFVSRSDLVLISFWMLTIPWIFDPISFYGASRFIVFQTKNGALLFLPCSHKHAVAHMGSESRRCTSVGSALHRHGGAALHNHKARRCTSYAITTK